MKISLLLFIYSVIRLIHPTVQLQKSYDLPSAFQIDKFFQNILISRMGDVIMIHSSSNKLIHSQGCLKSLNASFYPILVETNYYIVVINHHDKKGRVETLKIGPDGCFETSVQDHGGNRWPFLDEFSSNLYKIHKTKNSLYKIEKWAFNVIGEQFELEDTSTLALPRLASLGNALIYNHTIFTTPKLNRNITLILSITSNRMKALPFQCRSFVTQDALLLCQTREHRVILFDLSTQRQRQTFSAHKQQDIFFYYENACFTFNYSILCWKTKGEFQSEPFTLLKHGEEITKTFVMDDNIVVIYTQNDNKLHIFTEVDLKISVDLQKRDVIEGNNTIRLAHNSSENESLNFIKMFVESPLGIVALTICAMLIIALIAIVLRILTHQRPLKDKNIGNVVVDSFDEIADETTQWSYDEEEEDEMPYNNPFGSCATLVPVCKELSVPGFLLLKPNISFRINYHLTNGGMSSINVGEILDSKLMDNCDQKQVIVKVFDINRKNPKFTVAKDLFYQEISVMWFFYDNPYIARIIGFVDDPLMLVMKFYPMGTLGDWIKLYERPLDLIMEFMKDISCGIYALHSEGFLHRDLKPQNILIDYNHEFKRYSCVLSDFGLSVPISSQHLLVMAFNIITIRGFTKVYASPELLSSMASFTTSLVSCNPAIDIYAFGVIMYEMLCGFVCQYE